MLKLAYSTPEIEPIIEDAQVVNLASYRGLTENWNILLVEDDPSDVALTEIALNAAAIRHTTHSVRSGNQALGVLNGKNEPGFETPPDIVFLDLSLPDKDGFEILAEIFATAKRYRNLPFVILTGSEHFQYITHTYNVWMPAYLTKPCTADKMQEAFEAVRRHHLPATIQ